MRRVAVLVLSAVLLVAFGFLLSAFTETTPVGSSSWTRLNDALYTRKGKVYRFFPNCGKEPADANGCFVALPVYER